MREYSPLLPGICRLGNGKTKKLKKIEKKKRMNGKCCWYGSNLISGTRGAGRLLKGAESKGRAAKRAFAGAESMDRGAKSIQAGAKSMADGGVSKVQGGLRKVPGGL